MKEEIQEIQTLLGEIKEQMTDLRETITDFKETMNDGFDRMGERFDSIDYKLYDVKKTLTSISSGTPNKKAEDHNPRLQ